MPDSLADDLALALRLADAADEITSAGFTGAAVAHDLKSDGSPVSAVDVAVERRISELVAAERPWDAILGEEVGEIGSSERRWIVDGIDGTVLFVEGTPGWSTLIALEVDGEPVVGVSTGGGQDHRWWAARGSGAWNAPAGGSSERLSVNGRADMTDARYSMIPPLDSLGADLQAVVAPLAAATYAPPMEDGTPIHGALLVVDGSVEVCVQPTGGPWDFAALSVIVEEAGGRVTDLHGHRDIYGGGPIVYSNGRVHDAVLAALGN